MKALLLTLLLSLTSPLELAYSERVPAAYRAAFCQEVGQVAARLQVKSDWLMVVMSFETGGSFRANVRHPYSGATGLIQFIPSTARNLGTTTERLARLTPVEQLYYVEKYFRPYGGRMNTVYDVYLVVFAPAFLGRPDSQVLYRANARDALGRRRYQLNRVLDGNRDGRITIADVKNQIRKHVPKGI